MKNKILTISIIFILLSFIFINTNVFAVSSDKLVIDGYDMSDIYNHFSKDNAFFIYELSNTDFSGKYLFYKQSKLSNYSYNMIFEDGIHIGLYNSSWNYYKDSYDVPYVDIYYFDIESSTFKFGWTDDLRICESTVNNMVIKYSSKGIYNTDKTTFFMNPPAPTILAAVLEANKPTQMFQILMKNVVISLLVFVVSYLAFRKAWSFLRIQLKGS